MNELVKDGTIYKAKLQETNVKQCAINREKRILFLSNLDIYRYDTFSECKKDWKYITEHFSNDSDLCICGQEIGTAYVIKNTRNNVLAQVGSSCIEHINKEALKEYKKRVKKQEKYRECTICKEYVIKKTEEAWKVKCIKCWKKTKNRNM